MADNKISKYLNTYNEGEFLSPDDVRRGQDFIKANIPLGLGLAPILPTTQQTEMTSPVSTNQNPIIRNAGIFLEPTQPKQLSLSPMSQSTSKQQDDDSGRFLASLIAQGAAGFGTGISGGSAADIQRSAGAFQTMRDTQENQRRAKLLTDPNSEESKKKREVYKSLGYQVPNNLSATDLNDPTVLQTLKTQMQEQKLAAMPRGGIGVGQIKEEKRKDPTEAERLSLGFAKRTESSNKMLNNLEDKFLNKEGGFSPSSQFGYAPERFKSSERKNYEAAQKDFIGAVLRKESGASISDEEFQREAEKFFPLAGDDQKNIQFKQLLRKQAINNLKTSANIRYVKDNQTGETVEIDPFGNVLRRYKE